MTAPQNGRIAELLIVFCRWPRPGAGKTRLAAGLGMELAQELERAFLADTLGWASSWPRVLVAFTPPDAEAHFSRILPDADLRSQAEGDLGERITEAFDDAFGLGARRAVIVGSDSPNLPEHILRGCFDRLDQADVTLAPAADGGFTALGLRHPPGRLLHAVPWSTHLVLQHVRANAAAAELTVASTPGWYDVDDLSDLTRLASDLAQNPERAPATTRVLSRLGVLDSTAMSWRRSHANV